MSAVAPGWKLRVLLAQALFADPECCCSTSRRTTSTSTRSDGSKTYSTERRCTMVIISHDRHFLNSVCTHMADLDYGELRSIPRKLR